MKCTIPEISWHNREPVLSVDIHPNSTDFYRLATGGGDCHILIWQTVIEENGAVKLDVISDLTRHQRAVNSVRWSPSGQYLASADDDANIIVWQPKTDNIPLLDGDSNDKEIWNVYKVLRGHKEDIYDLCWSPNSLKLFSGSVDNTAILWDITKGKMDHILSDHKGFVQGVAWDPKDQIIATISTDRICRLFECTGKQVKARIHKGQLPVSEDHHLYEKEVKFFHDDTFKSFFRRLQFSPDGSLLIVPSGHVEAEDCKKILNATLVFTMDCLKSPVAVLPLVRQCSTVVRCCPILFELRTDGPDPIINLPYRMIIAVGTDHDVILYDTQQTTPFARFHEIHYTRLTDLTWSSDGLLLIASSTDGFCALITFDPQELGVAYSKEEVEVEESPMDISGCEELEKDENVDINNKEKVKKSSFLLQWAKKTPQKNKDADFNIKEGGDGVLEIVDDDVEIKPAEVEKINRLVPKRIAPKKVEEKKDASPKVAKDLAAKPIAVRRKPRDVETSQKLVKDGKNGKEKTSSVPEEQLVQKNGKKGSEKLDAEENLMNISGCMELQEMTDQETEKKAKRQSFLKQWTLSTPKAKKIKLDDKAVKDNADLTEETPKVNILIPKRVPTKKVEEKPVVEAKNEAKPIAVRRKPKAAVAVEEKTEETSKKPDESLELPTEKKLNKKTPTKPRTAPILKIKLKKIDDQLKEAVKKNKSPVRKKQLKTPPPVTPPENKKNPLLNFLKSSAEKESKPDKKTKTTPKGKKKKVIVAAPPECVDLTLDENEARDAWTSSKETSASAAVEIVEKPVKLEEIEDYTEDFCLQLEETQPLDKETDGNSINTQSNTRVNKILKEQEQVVKVVENNGKLPEDVGKSLEKGKSDVSEDSDDSRCSDKLKLKDCLGVVPRRVALITLSSPKSKKKEKP